MAAKLFCRTGDLAGRDYFIEHDATIGRGDDNAIVVPQKLVSHAHARISFDPAANAYVLEDLGSRNGTKLDGLPVRHPEPLAPLSVITLAERYDFIFQVLEARGAQADASSRTHPRGLAADHPASDQAPPGRAREGATTDWSGQPVRPPRALARPSSQTEVPLPGPAGPPPAIVRSMTARPAPVLLCEIREGDGEARRAPLAEGRHVVGSSADCNIRVMGSDLADRHAVISIEGDAIGVEAVTDGASVSVADEPVVGTRPLRPGEVVRLGATTTVAVVRNIP